MRKYLRQYILLGFFACVSMSLSAQEVSTTNMLEMAPYRHQINPAFEPITEGYFYFPALSHLYLYGGNNSLAMRDLIINQGGKTMWSINPESQYNLYSAFRKNTLVRGQASVAVLGFGFRLKNDGYFHLNIDANVDAGLTLPRDLFGFALDGGMKDLTGGINSYNLQSLGARAQAYLSLGFGYSKQVNDQWTWGMKVKLLDGFAYVGTRQDYLTLNASTEEWNIDGRGQLAIAGPLNKQLAQVYPMSPEYEAMKNWAEQDKLIDTKDIGNLLTPSGYGAAFDLGFTYQPDKHVKLSLALTDVGAIYWNRGRRMGYDVNGTYNGVGTINYADYTDEDGNFDSNRLKDTIVSRLENVYKTALTGNDVYKDKQGFWKRGFLAPLTMKLNAGVDAYFCNDILGLGLYSKTMLYNTKIYEEVTVGASVRPASWFNFGLSYSVLNGRWNNVGAAIGLRGGPFALTIAADYVPMTYAYYQPEESAKKVGIPYKAQGLNVELGLNIVWGWKGSKRDADKDGVLDKWDMCPETPFGVRVDSLGCPLDSDGDGVPDYLDECMATPPAAYGLIDEKGCPIDTDGDGVPDYLDECPGTPAAAYGKVDEKGCALDSDGDGVPDYLDECPDTPAEAIGHVDEKGCPTDADGDGVMDYMDQCPETPEGVQVDSIGCPLDTDGDGVPDYLDECPDTPAEARGFVDEKGCPLDTDGDGVFDYEDKCPEIAGSKENKGCPALSKTVKNIFKKAMTGIQFETGKAVIKKSSYGILDQVAQIFLDNPTYMAEVQGHTDNVGKADMNMKLSDNRANAVRDYLIKKGVAADRLTAKGYGDTMPKATNSTSAGRAQNRRVEFDVTFEEVHTEIVNQYADPAAADTTSVTTVTTLPQE